MRLLCLSFVISLSVFGALQARADFDVYPYALGGKIVTGGHDDVLGLNNVTERVFGYSFGEDPADPFFIGDPGFNNGTEGIGIFPGDGLLPTFSTLGFNVLTNLQYWTGAGSVSFAAAPAEFDLGITRGSNTVHIGGLGLTGTVPTIGSTGAAGRLHVHVQSTLNAADGADPNPPNAPEGIYMFGLEVTLAGSGLANSDPIYFVYSSGSPDPAREAALELAQGAAIDWVQNNLVVPEPSSWTLASLALLLGGSGTWRRRAKRTA